MYNIAVIHIINMHIYMHVVKYDHMVYATITKMNPFLFPFMYFYNEYTDQLNVVKP